MKLYIEADDGSRIELRDIDTIDQSSDVLLMFTNKCMIRPADREAMERAMTEKIGKKCVLFDGTISKVVGI